MTEDDDREALEARIALLQIEHRDLDASISALLGQPHVDQIQVQRLKRRKLFLRDEIEALKDGLTPDIIA
ncbi:MAG: DUF465 domain-containing protein [Proteobacteria bacterium]|jgi:hypothetical protein|nr:DUF465 domain-containing protein [Pseudomonadota bacterium]